MTIHRFALYHEHSLYKKNFKKVIFPTKVCGKVSRKIDSSISNHHLLVKVLVENLIFLSQACIDDSDSEAHENKVGKIYKTKSENSNLPKLKLFAFFIYN